MVRGRIRGDVRCEGTSQQSGRFLKFRWLRRGNQIWKQSKCRPIRFERFETDGAARFSTEWCVVEFVATYVAKGRLSGRTIKGSRGARIVEHSPNIARSTSDAARLTGVREGVFTSVIAKQQPRRPSRRGLRTRTVHVKVQIGRGV